MKHDLLQQRPPGFLRHLCWLRAVSDRQPSVAEIAEINATHLIDTPLRPADLLFVFATRRDEALRASEACRLWREGYVRWSIVSGGLTPTVGSLRLRDHQAGDGRRRHSA